MEDWEKRRRERDRREKEDTENLRRSRIADERNARMNEQMVRNDNQRLQSEMVRNREIADAARRESIAKQKLMAQQGKAAIAESVGELDEDGLRAVDAYYKQEEDRANIQAMFNRIGDCLACIEQKGKDTEKFKSIGYGDERQAGKDWWSHAELKAGERRAGGVSFVYRYHNLTAVIGQLIDLREEVQRVRIWDANRSREETLNLINQNIKLGKHYQVKTAAKAVKTIRKNKAIWMKVAIAAAAVWLVGELYYIYEAMVAPEDDFGGGWLFWGLYAGIAAAYPIALPFTKRNCRTPDGWEDMLEIVDDGDDF